MGKDTAIGWTDHTYNPWWGCTRVSPGCARCYAETFAKRTGHAVWGQNAPRRTFGDKHWLEPLKWNRDAEAAGRPALVFCASMADVFEDHPEVVEERERLWRLIGQTQHLRWLLLTKRPENVLGMVPWFWLPPEGAKVTHWPDNVWVGTTVEDQQRAAERLDHLAFIPAPVRFLSCEPLLGPVDLTPWIASVDWIIAGGESGARHRPLNLDHARALRDQADAAGVPFFLKQIGGQYPTSGGDELDGETRKAWPHVLEGLR